MTGLFSVAKGKRTAAQDAGARRKKDTQDRVGGLFPSVPSHLTVNFGLNWFRTLLHRFWQ
jgi:hypothetical protein